jgi:hypothetical protein
MNQNCLNLLLKELEFEKKLSMKDFMEIDVCQMALKDEVGFSLYQ